MEVNSLRRKRIRQICNGLNELLEELREIWDDETDARDNMPESMWGTERYEKAETACDCMEEAADALESALEQLEEAME